MANELVPHKLKQMLLMLSSDNRDEAATAASLITQYLKKHGSTWHDLANGLIKETPAKKPADERPPWEGEPDFPEQKEEQGPESTLANWRLMREYCLNRPYRLRDREIEFLKNIGRWRGDLTDKQFAWLAAIYSRLSDRWTDV